MTATYRRWYPVIHGKCARMLRDPAEADDVAQEAFLRFWQKGLSDRDTEVAVAWVYKTATRLAIDRLRRQRTAQDHKRSVKPAPPALTDAVAARSTLAELARLVSEPELTAAVLHRMDGMTHAEVAKTMAVSDRTVRRLLTRFDERTEALRAEAR